MLKRPRRFATILLVVLTVRVLFLLLVWRTSGWEGISSPDSYTYILPAQSLLREGTFAINGVPQIFRTPGYPLLLTIALVFKRWAAIALLQNLVLVAACVCLIYLIADALCVPESAPWAAALFCLEPVGLTYSVKILSETLFCAELLLFIWLFLRFLRQPGSGRLLLAASALCITTYTRPVTMFFGVWMIPILLVSPFALEFNLRLRYAVLFPLFCVIFLAPWIIRNKVVAQYPGITAIADSDLYFYHAAFIAAKAKHKPFSQYQAELGFDNPEQYFLVHPEQRSWSEGQRALFWREEAKKTISRNLGEYAQNDIKGMVVVALDPGATQLLLELRLYPASGGMLAHVVNQGMLGAGLFLFETYPVVGVVTVILGTQLLVYYASALNGLRYLGLEPALFIGWTALYFFLVSGGPLAESRLRLPIMLVVCILGGVGIANWIARRRGVAAMV
jgi:hypothetical protein